MRLEQSGKTMPTPYSAIWGAKTTSIDVMRSLNQNTLSADQKRRQRPGGCRHQDGQRDQHVSAQVNMADAVWVASAWSPRASWPAIDRNDDRRQGPPAATSKTTLGSWFAAW
jgi:hypothetical protein